MKKPGSALSVGVLTLIFAAGFAGTWWVTCHPEPNATEAKGSYSIWAADPDADPDAAKEEAAYRTWMQDCVPRESEDRCSELWRWRKR